MAKRILMVLTSHEDMGVSGKKTGNWFDEVATPFYKFREEGFEVVVASPKGGKAPIDPFSYEEAFMTDNTKKFLKDDAALRVLGNTAKLSEINYASFDAAFFPGGYGQLWDLASDSKALQVIQDLIEAEKPVAMICHAPAILRDAKKRNGKPLVTGRRLTGFSNSEDDELNLSRHLLFQLETSLKEKGANYVRSAKNWEPFVVEDGALITGQNPGSAPGIAAALCNRLR
jgi:putative intracellular protease/amidase